MQIIVSNLFTTSLTLDVAACLLFLYYESISKSFTLGPEKKASTQRAQVRANDDDVMYSRAMNNNINLT